MDQSALIRFDDALPLDAAPRMDLYGPVHKALRALMFDAVGRLGRCDADDARERVEALGIARRLLVVCRQHLKHENDFVHTAMEARRPGSSAPTADDHVDHALAIDALEAAVDGVEAAPPARRGRAMYTLYLRFARFVAENLEHMEVEETHNASMLRDAYDDAELLAIHDRLVASIPPEEMMLFQRWILGAVSHPERVGMLSGMRAGAPPQVFEAAVAQCRDVLAPDDWVKLANALDLPAGAGAIEVW